MILVSYQGFNSHGRKKGTTVLMYFSLQRPASGILICAYQLSCITCVFWYNQLTNLPIVRRAKDIEMKVKKWNEKLCARV